MKKLFNKIFYTEYKLVDYSPELNDLVYETVVVSRLKLYSILVKINLKLFIYRVKTLIK